MSEGGQERREGQFADELEEAFSRAGLKLRLRAEREGDKRVFWGAFLFDGAPRE